ncbi:glycoside hydrolase family 2 protein [Polaribacter porphyrae]|uniref:Beta-galactosidase n=1 Tax=Polaribacter porphyrae TaxID=1137780 RepID=A0A2S7WNE0_9FLAO|nr:glycoside hydrolase family 2 TIM barrel-domain containing protein [Polaribacter porphyrae]PQJ79110.1 hypothetical protein BTO18_07980 [Polaribacter porphyrae]
MKIKNLVALLILSFTTLYVANAQEFLKERNTKVLTDWKFSKSDYWKYGTNLKNGEGSIWKNVKIPHTWNAKDVLTDGVNSYHGVGTYMHKLEAQEINENVRHFIRFEGVSLKSEVYINGEFVGEHLGGYSAFCFEITDFLKKDEANEIGVKVNNIPSRNMAPSAETLFPVFGGIYRPVTYFTTKQTCISPLDFASSGVYISQTSVTKNKAVLDVAVLVSSKNTSKSKKIVFTIQDKEGNVALQESENFNFKKNSENQLVKKRLTVNKPHLWQGTIDPYQYIFKVTLLENNSKIDEINHTMGLRSFEVTARKGFFLNNKSYPLYGVNRHQEIEGFGSALSSEQHQQDFELIKELGVSSVRLSHYQQAEEFYDLFSKSGIMVWAEIPNTPPYIKNNPKYLENCKLQIEEMIKQNFNQTAIYCWGLGNEIRIPKKDLKILHDFTKSLDNTRYSVFVDNVDANETHTVTDIQAWNMYYGWYGEGLKDGYSKKTNRIHKKFPEIKIGIAEFGAGGSISQQKEDFERPEPISGKFFPEQYQTHYHENAWNDMKDRDDIWCKYIWNMFDFSWTTVERGDRNFINHKGLVTHNRKTKKDAFYFYKANWSKKPVLHITNKRLIKREKEITFVKVYSNLKKVELFVNGISKGIKERKSDRFILQWNEIKLQKGKNKIDVIGLSEEKKFTDSCEWNFIKNGL